MKNKIIIGTANFFNDYGLFKNKVNHKEVYLIKKYLKEKKFLLDTSFNYRNLAKLFKVFTNYSKYIIKISLNKKNKNKLEKIFQNLKLKHNIKKKFYAILLHNTEILKTKEGRKIYQELYKLKKKVAKKVGISTYGAENIEFLQKKKLKFDMIQTNGNILDNRFFQFLKTNRKIKFKEIHIRSIFLQGLLLYKKIPKKFKNHFHNINQIKIFSKRNNLSVLDLLIYHVYKYEMHGMVFGVKNKSEIAEIFNSIKKIKKIKKLEYNYSNSNLSLIDPRRW